MQQRTTVLANKLIIKNLFTFVNEKRKKKDKKTTQQGNESMEVYIETNKTRLLGN